MTRKARLLRRILGGGADASIRFRELCELLRSLRFEERVRGDHHIFTRADVEEILNLQPKDGQAKAYQVRQVRQVLARYGLAGEDDDD